MKYFELIAAVARIIQDDSFSSVDIGSYINQAQTEIAGGLPSTLGSWITPPLPDLLTIDTITTDVEDAAYTTYSSIKTLISSGDTLVFTYNDVEVIVSITGDYSTLQTDINTALVANSFTAEDVVASWSGNDLILTCNGTTLSTDSIVGGLYTDTDTAATTTPTDTAYVAALPYVSMPTTFQRTLQFAASSSGYEINIASDFISFSETYPLLNQSGRISEVAEFGGLFYYQGIPTSAEDVTLHFYRFPVDMAAETDTPDGIPTHLQKSLLTNHAAWKIFELIEDGLDGPGPNTQRYMGLFQIALQALEMSIPYTTRGMQLI